MRNAAEMIARLAEHGIDLHHIPGGASSFAALDVAGALGMGHDRLGADLVLAKYALSALAYRSAKAGWRMSVGDHALASKWDRGKPGVTFALADYSLAEWIDPMRCRTCRGADVVIANVKRTCPACEGTGLRTPSDRSISRALGLSANGYRNGPWPGRLKWARAELQRVESVTLAKLNRALRPQLTPAQNGV